MKYRIAWRAIYTGFEGFGETFLDKATADAWCERLNREWYGTIRHWVVEVVE